jgi:hypothetical protein
VYHWDGQTYVASTVPFLSPTSTPIPDASTEEANNSHQISQDLFDIQRAFAEEEYIKTIELADSISESLPENELSTRILAPAYYSRALALEALNRLDEALAEYAAIYTDAPYSIWGALAALHLEIITP